ncbi:hypothetical protein LTR10_018229 [Elasticomyces elasticus]|nr:hypothetical protein LTR10_018229 [Elasticomyces elasticus]KAK5185630.1 hypothetical protein LTR44_001679 [Eurotiomycetes sp. CCFEE 6388]
MIPSVMSIIRGDMAVDCKRLHDQYGDIVRISPWELSYRNADAWKDIYAHRTGHTLLPKEPFFYSPVSGHPNIVFSDHATHARIRRTVANAFSEKALRQQEDLIKVHIDLLMQRLNEMADEKMSFDIVMWYNFCTFDLIGDLSLGQAFGCLRKSELHPWVRMQFLLNQSFSFFMTASMIPFGFKLFDLILGNGVLKARDEHVKLTDQAVKKRLATKTDRPDFLYFMQRDIGSEGDRLSVDELVSNAGALISAGSETTATLLSGATYHLLRNPEVMDKLCREIRGTFKSDEEINTVTLSGLKYLQAVMDEALRCYPPVPTGLPRIVPKGGEVLLGRYVPANTIVSVNNWASYQSAKFFKDPERFVPERWMGDARYADDDRKIFQPFSVGPRVCLGRNLAYMEMRLILAKVLYNFDLHLLPKYNNWMDQKVWVIWDKQPMHVTLTRTVKQA